MDRRGPVAGPSPRKGPPFSEAAYRKGHPSSAVVLLRTNPPSGAAGPAARRDHRALAAAPSLRKGRARAAHTDHPGPAAGLL